MKRTDKELLWGTNSVVLALLFCYNRFNCMNDIDWAWKETLRMAHYMQDRYDEHVEDEND